MSFKPYEGYVIRKVGEGDLISWVHLGRNERPDVLLMERSYRPGHWHTLVAPTPRDFDDLERDPMRVYERARCPA